MEPSPHEVTRLLAAFSAGQHEALDALLPLVYDELRRLAHRQRHHNPAHATLNTTALVHEAYVKLAGRASASWEDRAHFYRIAARVMRDILVDYARRQRAAKRGGDRQPVALTDLGELPDVHTEEVLAVDEALRRLEALDPRQGRVVELRYFVGLSIPETAEALGLSESSVKRDWTAARAWLYREMTR
jgi:RNA polymerase sigma factor (TIGR02999 family)